MKVLTYIYGQNVANRMNSISFNHGERRTSFSERNDRARLTNDANEPLSATYEYGPFGELLSSTGSMASSNPFRFSTKYCDSETDLYYYGYRYYNSSLGRWISRDPIEEQGGLNLYCFVNNDPVNRVDKLGLVTDAYLYYKKDYTAKSNVSQNETHCCDYACDVEGEKQLMGRQSFLTVRGKGINEDSQAKKMSRQIGYLLKTCKRQGSYVGIVGNVIMPPIVKVATDLEIRNNGIELYTVLVYRECSKKGCGGFWNWFSGHKCCPLHWVVLTTNTRQCSPKPEERSVLFDNPNIFIDEDVANKAKERCEEEHIREESLSY